MRDLAHKTEALARLGMACELSGGSLSSFATWDGVLPAWLWVSESLDSPRLMFRPRHRALAGEPLAARSGMVFVELEASGARSIRVLGAGELAVDLELAEISRRPEIAARLCSGNPTAGVATDRVIAELGPDRADDLVAAAELAGVTAAQRRLLAGLHPLLSSAAPALGFAGADTLAVEYRGVSMRGALRLLSNVSPLDGDELGGRLGALAGALDVDRVALLRLALAGSEPYGISVALNPGKR